MALPFEIEFGAFLVYSPSGKDRIAINSRAIRDAIKGDKSLKIGGQLQRAIPHFAAAIMQRLKGSAIEDFFVRKPLLVPAPRSSLMVPGALYPTRLLCAAMVGNGLGSDTRVLLERTAPVAKAAFCAPADRPTIQQHYETLRVTDELVSPTEIVVIDDIVTRGTMFLAAVARLKEAYPAANVRAFALIRTMSGQEIPHILEPCRGAIYRRDAWGTRRP